MNRTIARRLSAALSVALAVTLSACGGSGGDSSSGSEVTSIVMGHVGEPTLIPDPIVDGSLVGVSYYYNTFDSLTRLDPDGKIVPWLATEWTSNEDFTEWTFEIRDDVKFHNGDPLTAEDVAYTYETIMATPDSQPRTYLAPLGRTEATGPTTVVFHLKEPFSTFPSLATGASIVPKKVHQELGSEGFAEAPVGSGPYKFVSRTRGVDYVIERNDDYWGEKAPYERVTYQLVTDEDGRLNGVVSGSLNVALIAPNQVDSLEGQGSVDVKSLPSNGVTYLGINSTKGPLADQRVRQAIELAVDKEALTKTVLSGRAEVATQMIAPSVGGYDSSMEPSSYDTDKAKALLAEAGYKGEPIVLEYAEGGRIPLSGEVVQTLQDMLGKVGIKVVLKGMDQATLSEKIYASKTMKGLYLNGYAPAQMDGDPVVETMFAGDFNDYAMRDETKKMVQETRRVAGEERIKVYGELMRYNAEHALLIPLYVPENSYVATKGLDWEPRLDGLFYYGAPIR